MTIFESEVYLPSSGEEGSVHVTSSPSEARDDLRKNKYTVRVEDIFEMSHPLHGLLFAHTD